MMLDLKEKGNLKKIKCRPQWGAIFKNLTEESKTLFGGAASRIFCVHLLVPQWGAIFKNRTEESKTLFSGAASRMFFTAHRPHAAPRAEQTAGPGGYWEFPSPFLSPFSDISHNNSTHLTRYDTQNCCKIPPTSPDVLPSTVNSNVVKSYRVPTTEGSGPIWFLHPYLPF